MNVAQDLPMTAGSTPHEAPPGFEPFPSTAGFIRRCGGFYYHAERDVVGVRILPEHLNPLGFSHGGLLATLVDMAVGFALRKASAASLPPPTITLSIDYLSPAREGAWIEAPVTIQRLGRRISNATCNLMDGKQLVASGRAVFVAARPDA